MRNSVRNSDIMKPEIIKKWLKQHDRTREWLAAQCGVSKPTVDGWLSGRNIPKPALRNLEVLILGANPIKPKFTIDEFSAIQSKASSMNMTVEEFISNAIKKALLLGVLLLGVYHVTRSPKNWSAAAMLETGKSALAYVKGKL